MWFSWSVTSVTPGINLTSITTFLRGINPASNTSTYYGLQKLAIPVSNLSAPATYQVSLSLTNFLGYKTTSSKVSITRVSAAIPSVQITGPSRRSVYRTSELSIFALASSASCSKVCEELEPGAAWRCQPVWSVE